MIYVAAIVSLIVIGLGLVIFFNNRRSAVNKIFFLYAVMVALWIFFNSVALHTTSDTLALLCVRLVMVVTSPLFAILFYLSLTYPNGTYKFKTWQKICTLCIVLASMVVSLSPYMFVGVERSNTGLSPIAGSGIAIYAINVLIFIPLAMYNFYKRWRETQGLSLLQLKYIISSFVLAIIIAIITNFILVIFFQDTQWMEIGTLSAAIFMVALPSYPILQQRLFGIEYVFGKIIYYLMISAFVFLDLLLFNYLRGFFIGNELGWLFLAIFAFISALLFLFFNNFTNNMVEQNIIHHGINVDKLQKKYLQDINKEESLEIIIDRLFNLIEESLGVERMAISLATEENDLERFRMTREMKINFTVDDKRTAASYWDNADIGSKPIIYEENIIDKLPANKKDAYKKLRATMTKYQIKMTFPLYFNDAYQGVIVLGEKKRQIAYYSQDINFLQSVLGETVSVLGRAMLYERTKKFNETLQMRIDVATKDLNKAYRDLEVSYQKLQQLDKVKDEFVSVASHELRTPMTAIKNSIFMARKDPVIKSGSRLERFLEITYQSTQRLIDLVNDMLTISRMESGTMQLRKKEIDLMEIINKVHKELEFLAEEKNIYFKIQTDVKEIKMNGDGDKLHEVLTNLVGNALKFTQKGGVMIKAYVKAKKAYVEVIDTGMGIKKDDIDKIFVKFTRLEDSYTKIKETGTGLGLHIAHQIAKKHRGKILVDSKWEKGSTFTLILPL